MIDGRSVLALVPARGGSKGLPGKNIRSLCGRPLIQWSIEAGLSSRFVDLVVVSTDSQEIADVGMASGASVPFIRPPDLASDAASSIDVVVHALDFLAQDGKDFDVVVLLEPTSPLRDSSDIDQALQSMTDRDASAIVSVCRAESSHPAFVFRKTPDGHLAPFMERPPTGLRRQEIEPMFFLDGSIYASDVQVLRARRSFYHSDTIAYEVPKWKSFEIDDLEDFQIVEALASYKGLGLR